MLCLLFGATVYSQSLPDTTKRAELVTPDSISAKDLGSLLMDPHVTGFVVTWFDGATLYTFKISGNGIFGEARTKIEALPAGTKVIISEINRKEDDGSVTTAPTQLRIIK